LALTHDFEKVWETLYQSVSFCVIDHKNPYQVGGSCSETCPSQRHTPSDPSAREWRLSLQSFLFYWT
jgi:hypothetical protein